MKSQRGPTRRAVLGAGAGLTAAGVAGWWGMRTTGAGTEAVEAGASDQSPHIVLIALDDVGYGDWSSYGSKRIDTPHIDAVGADGMTFSQMYAGGPVCTPARAALLTGRYPQRVGLPWVEVEDNARKGMSDYEHTLGEVLDEAGYRTGIFGKWHLGDPGVRPELNPVYHGFDTFVGTPRSNQPERFPLYDGTDISEWLNDKTQVELSRRCTDRAIEFIEQNRDHPFFCYLPYNPAHTPYHVEKEFQGTSKAGPYGDLVQQADHHIGRVLQSLEDQGLTENTLVMITSDNGPVNQGTGGLRGGKGSTFEGGIRVPFVARWPGHIAAGSSHDQPACFTDVLPTLATVSGGHTPTDRPIDGIDLSPAWADRDTPDRTLYHYHDWTLNAVRRGVWKLHLPRREGGDGHKSGNTPQQPLLYNIDEDEGEQHNLADDKHKKVVELTKAAGQFDNKIQAQKDEALRRARGET